MVRIMSTNKRCTPEVLLLDAAAEIVKVLQIETVQTSRLLKEQNIELNNLVFNEARVRPFYWKIKELSQNTELGT
jgi:hypothetical protein